MNAQNYPSHASPPDHPSLPSALQASARLSSQSSSQRFQPSLRFQPSIAASILALCFVSAFIALGLWQLDRAQQKEVAQASLSEIKARPPILVPAERVKPETLVDQHIEALGEFDAAHQFFLDNQVHQGRVGYHVITPLFIQGSSPQLSLLVNRGWVAAGANRSQLPDAPVPAGLVRVVGIAHVPGASFQLAAPEPGWQRVWQSLDLARFAALTNNSVQPVVLRLDADSATGFVREWSEPAQGVGRHTSYAVQWFAFAFMVTCVWLWKSLRQDDTTTTTQETLFHKTRASGPAGLLDSGFRAHEGDNTP